MQCVSWGCSGTPYPSSAASTCCVNIIQTMRFSCQLVRVLISWPSNTADSLLGLSTQRWSARFFLTTSSSWRLMQNGASSRFVFKSEQCCRWIIVLQLEIHLLIWLRLILRDVLQDVCNSMSCRRSDLDHSWWPHLSGQNCWYGPIACPFSHFCSSVREPRHR